MLISRLLVYTSHPNGYIEAQWLIMTWERSLPTWVGMGGHQGQRLNPFLAYGLPAPNPPYLSGSLSPPEEFKMHSSLCLKTLREELLWCHLEQEISREESLVLVPSLPPLGCQLS